MEKIFLTKNRWLHLHRSYFEVLGVFLNVCFFFRRTTMKRSVENLPDDEGKNITREKSFSGCLILDQPSAKRPMHTTSTSYSDN